MARTITDEELNALNRAILTRYGLDFFHYEPTSFKRRVSRVINKFGLESSLELWRRIIQDKDFIYVFIDEITVGLTAMFRNSDFWIKLRNELLPELNEKTAFSIWHAGCSTGEEVYSMAILLSEANLLDKATVVATDLNSQSIRLAQEGLFSGINHDMYHANYRAAQGKGQLSDYYEMKGEDMCFNRVDTRHVQFYQHNLSKDGMNQQFDIIFCRNVMIYFDEVLKLKVLELFNNSLKEGGLLIIGYYDALPADYRKWFTLLDPHTRIFRKSSVNQLILQPC
jgi:chemotaxis protein methyltransferase CheR